MKHRLVQDCDGHWYVILVSEEAEFNKWLEAQCIGISPNSPGSSIDFDTMRVNGPHTITFDNWEEE